MYNHSQIINQFVAENPGYQTTGLASSLRARFPFEEWDLRFVGLGYIPDAFRLTDDKLHILEVDKSSILDHKKLPKILGLWETLDHAGMPMEMTIISGYTLARSTIGDLDFARMWNDAMIGYV